MLELYIFEEFYGGGKAIFTDKTKLDNFIKEFKALSLDDKYPGYHISITKVASENINPLLFDWWNGVDNNETTEEEV